MRIKPAVCIVCGLPDIYTTHPGHKLELRPLDPKKLEDVPLIFRWLDNFNSQDNDFSVEENLEFGRLLRVALRTRNSMK